MRIRDAALFTLTVHAALASTSAAHPRLRGLGAPLPGGNSEVHALSDDGLVVVGRVDFAAGPHAFRWEAATGFVDLGVLPGHEESVALGVSADGSRIVGCSGVGEGPGAENGAFLWDEAEGLREIAADACAATISADGQTVVGSIGGEVFRWSEAGGLEILGGLGPELSMAPWDVSTDGGVIAGGAYRLLAPGGVLAFRWDQATGFEDLGALPGDDSAEARGVSGDGAVIVGWSGSARRAVRWTRSEGFVPLGPGSEFFAAWAADADGDVVVGQAHDGIGQHGALWRGGSVTSLGALRCDGAPAEASSEARDVSADGTVVAGSAWTGESYEAFLATVGTGCAGPLGDLAPGSLDESTNPPTWRVSGDGELNVGDVVALLRAVVGVQSLACEE